MRGRMAGAKGGRESTSKHRRSCANSHDASEQALAARRVASAFDAVPDTTTDRSHGERAANVIEDAVRARIAFLRTGHMSELAKREEGTERARRDTMQASQIRCRRAVRNSSSCLAHLHRHGWREPSAGVAG